MRNEPNLSLRTSEPRSVEPAGVKERRRTRRSAYREKNAERLVQRNGYRDRSGRHAPTLPAAHPQAAQRLLLPGFLEPRRMAEKALAAVVQEAYVLRIFLREFIPEHDLLTRRLISKKAGVAHSEASAFRTFQESWKWLLINKTAHDQYVTNTRPQVKFSYY